MAYFLPIVMNVEHGGTYVTTSVSGSTNPYTSQKIRMFENQVYDRSRESVVQRKKLKLGRIQGPLKLPKNAPTFHHSGAHAGEKNPLGKLWLSSEPSVDQRDWNGEGDISTESSKRAAILKQLS